jgi:hypothetical protein
MSLGSRRLHSRPRLYIPLGFLDNGAVVSQAGSIDSLAKSDGDKAGARVRG